MTHATGRRTASVVSPLTLAVTALLLAGCATSPPDGAPPAPTGPPTSVAAGTCAGAPAGYESENWLAAGTPVAVWLDEGSSVSVTTFGSSSCPAILTEVRAIDEQSVRLEFVEDAVYAEQACTADVAALTHEVELPDEVTGRPLMVTVRVDESDTAREFVLA